MHASCIRDIHKIALYAHVEVIMVAMRATNAAIMTEAENELAEDPCIH